MIRLLIADDHIVLLDGLMAIFSSVGDIELVSSVSSGKQVIDILQQKEVDVILMDINMPDMDGLQTCKYVHKKYPHISVLALSMYKKPSYIKRMKQNGAKGYLLKDDGAEEIISAIRAVSKGEEYYSKQLKNLVLDDIFSGKDNIIPHITKREKEVLMHISKGSSNKKIAEILFVSVHTVISHRKNMLSKFGVKNSTELVRVAMESGLI